MLGFAPPHAAVVSLHLVSSVTDLKMVRIVVAPRCVNLTNLLGPCVRL